MFQEFIPQDGFHRLFPPIMARIASLGFWVFLAYCSYMGLTPNPGVEAEIPHFDKVLHVLGYGVLTGLALAGFTKMRLIVIFLALSAYGFAIEIIQGLMGEGRMFSIADMLANGVGSALVILAWIAFVSTFRRKAQP